MAENKVHLLLGESQTVWDVGHDLTIVVPLHGIVLNVRSTLHQVTHVIDPALIVLNERQAPPPRLA
jgi:hypothetical protein